MKITNVTQRCSQCRGDLMFDGAKQSLVCKKCGNDFSIIDNKVSTEKSFQELLQRAPIWQKESAVYCCDKCGAKSIVTKDDLSIKCEYCGAKDVNKTTELPGVRPDTVVCFNFAKKAAKHKVKNWLGKRFFVPDEFHDIVNELSLTSVYFPAFVFDANTFTRYHAVAEHTRTSTLTINGSEEITHKQTIRRPVSGVDEHIFNNIIILANNEIAYDALKHIEPFNFEQARAFKEEYLSGFSICQATKEPLQNWEEAKLLIQESIRKKITRKYSTVSLQNLQTEITITNVMYKYALLPIYMGQIEYKGKDYKLLVNGQTGKVHGKVPRSKWKVFSFFAIMGAIAAGLGIVVAMFL